jgi:hypothetical protein
LIGPSRNRLLFHVEESEQGFIYTSVSDLVIDDRKIRPKRAPPPLWNDHLMTPAEAKKKQHPPKGSIHHEREDKRTEQIDQGKKPVPAATLPYATGAM